jgi:two-component system NtrC family response regulator
MKQDDISILIIDDEPSLVESIKDFLEGYSVTVFTDPESALTELKKEFYDIVIVDYKMPNLNGDKLLLEAKKSNSYEYGILLSAYVDKKILEEFINNGLISQYFEKPYPLKKIKKTIDDAIVECEKRKNERRSKEKAKYEWDEFSYLSGEIIGLDKGLKNVLREVKKVAKHDEVVLLTGETGTGKELIAYLIHKMSPRKDGIFVKVNCAAIPENLAESELFGHVKGAFTGAVKKRKGKFELADKGTLFLDEIAEMNLVIQSKLLRVLQTKEFDRIGDDKTIKSDFRLISATNRDINKIRDEIQFRDDLYYRIIGFPIHLPPLRERKEDIEDLVTYFVRKMCNSMNRKIPGIHPPVFDKLKEYYWKGNVRELEISVMRAIYNIDERKKILPVDFNFLDKDSTMENLLYDDAVNAIVSVLFDKKKNWEGIMKDILNRAVERCGNNKLKAAKKTGIPKDRFYRNR